MSHDKLASVAGNSGQERRAFGRSLHVDFYEVSAALCEDLGFCYDLLDSLIALLAVHKQAPPFIFRSPTADYPDKAGLSGWVALIESGISIHTLTVRNFVSLDIYTCGQLDVDKTISYLCDRLQSRVFEQHFLLRGIAYYGEGEAE